MLDHHHKDQKLKAKYNFGDCYTCKNAIFYLYELEDYTVDVYCFCMLFHQNIDTYPTICCGNTEDEQEEMNKFLNE